MKVKSLLKILRDVEYVITTASGSQLTKGYIGGDGYWDDCNLEEFKILEVTTVQNCDKLFIKVKP
jgi:hypothetical protein